MSVKTARAFIWENCVHQHFYGGGGKGYINFHIGTHPNFLTYQPKIIECINEEMIYIKYNKN